MLLHHMLLIVEVIVYSKVVKLFKYISAACIPSSRRFDHRTRSLLTTSSRCRLPLIPSLHWFLSEQLFLLSTARPIHRLRFRESFLRIWFFPTLSVCLRFRESFLLGRHHQGERRWVGAVNSKLKLKIGLKQGFFSSETRKMWSVNWNEHYFNAIVTNPLALIQWWIGGLLGYIYS